MAMDSRSISLATKPGATLRISTFFPQSAEDQASSPSSSSSSSSSPSNITTLVVFLNGLVLPRSAWFETVDLFIKRRQDTGQVIPALLCYDRYGQGDSDPDPSDALGTPYGHDATAVVADLHQLLVQISQDDLKLSLADRNIRIIFVCNSIGCALARLYAAEHPGLVEAYLFLDSMMANSDFVSVFPDPDDAGFDAGQLPQDVSVGDLRHTREMYTKFFHPSVPNGERFDRRRLAEQLPYADQPALPLGSLSVPKPVTNAYMNPAWAAYNDGLTRLVTPGDGDSGGEVKIAKGCGHFIQRDDPAFVAAEIDSLLQNRTR
ncbi:Alpha/Beta hydrolase protein [Cercophora scortea]|uniref:Alpha/Beta hydrolase protein n=1 Tax=Cercophora scortea TaxID=314031 RepID=A0AAE0MJ41_9PEZI|nr:Alpha/Beta hydrolase protein [Cercophora scortea]